MTDTNDVDLSEAEWFTSSRSQTGFDAFRGPIRFRR